MLCGMEELSKNNETFSQENVRISKASMMLANIPSHNLLNEVAFRKMISGEVEGKSGNLPSLSDHSGAIPIMQ